MSAHLNETRVKVDIHTRLVQKGHSHDEAFDLVESYDVDGRDCYAMINDLGIEYRWTNKKVGSTTEQFED